MAAADRCLLVLPLFHVNGLMVSVVSPLVAGGSTVIALRFDPKTFWISSSESGARSSPPCRRSTRC
jgi:acyl-CoA synthetase (AMP-forming)/AMP-acid ligase II